jgi:hypothetical protein
LLDLFTNTLLRLSQHRHKKNTSFQLSKGEQIAFNSREDILTKDLVLRLPNLDLPFKVQADAAHFGIGAVLLQTHPQGDRPVCYMSNKLTSSQQRWSTIEQECFAFVTAVKC